MTDEIFSLLSTAMTGSLLYAILASFGWGVVSVLLSPCHLSSIPLIIGFINSQGKITLKRTFLISFVFGIGILITIAVIGLLTASAAWRRRQSRKLYCGRSIFYCRIIFNGYYKASVGRCKS